MGQFVWATQGHVSVPTTGTLSRPTTCVCRDSRDLRDPDATWARLGHERSSLQLGPEALAVGTSGRCRRAGTGNEHATAARPASMGDARGSTRHDTTRRNLMGGRRTGAASVAIHKTSRHITDDTPSIELAATRPNRRKRREANGRHGRAPSNTCRPSPRGRRPIDRLGTRTAVRQLHRCPVLR